MKYLLSTIFLLICSLVSLPLAAAPAGELDPTFGAGGIRTVGFDLGPGNSDTAQALAKSPDGRLYLVGSVSVAPNDIYRIGITRLSANGQLDVSFGLGGKLTYIDASMETAYVHDAVFQSDGKLLVAGTGRFQGDPNFAMMVCRFNADGSIDSIFGDASTPGCKILTFSPDTTAYAIAIQSNGRIVLAGDVIVSGKKRAVLVRLLDNGTLDSSFDFDGLKIPFSSWINDNNFKDVAIAGDGKIVAVGDSDPNGNSDYLVARFESNGALDLSFDGGFQLVKYDVGGLNRDHAYAVSLLADGSVLVAGYVDHGSSRNYAGVAKLTPDGQLDLSFFDGKNVYNPCIFVINGCDMRAYDMKVFPNGSIVVAGGISSPANPASNRFFAMKLTPSGERDSNFGSQMLGDEGMAYVDVSNDADVARRVDLQGERVLLAGYATPSQIVGRDFAIVRLDHGINTQVTVTPIAGPNGSISPGNPIAVSHSSVVNFTITPNAGFAIQSVTGCGGTLVGNTYTTAPVTQNCQINATFASNVTLTYNAGPNGSITGASPQVVPYNGNGTPVTAVPDANYKFIGWSDGSVANPRQDLNVTSNLNVTANFKILAYKVFVDEPTPGGTVTPGILEVDHGQHAQFLVQPDPGFGVVEVTSDGCEGTLVGNIYVAGPVVGPGSCAIQPVFAASDVVYPLNYTAGPNCSIQGELSQQVLSGNDGTAVTVVPDPGYVFVQWSDGSADTVRQDTHVFNPVDVTAQCVADGTPIYTVTPIYGQGGATSPPNAQLVPLGYKAQFKILPGPGYAIDTVSGCGAGSLVGNTYTTAGITADCQVTATFVASNTMYDLNYAAGFGGAIQGTASQQVISGGNGTPVTAVPNPGRYFVQWSDGSTDNPRQDKNVIANVDVTAQFAADGTYIVTPVASLGGSISPDLIQVVDAGAVLQFTVTPDVGFGIVSVSGCGGSLAGKVYTTGAIQADCKVQADFAPTDAVYLLKYAAGPNGSLDGTVEQVVPSGGSGTPVTANPEPGYIFLQWSDGSIENPRTDVSVIADVDVTAQFVLPDSIIVTPTAGVGGSISPNIKQVVNQGDVLQFTILPNPGFGIDAVGGTCGGSLNGKVYTTAPIAASCTVDASFVPSDQMYTLTYAAGANGSLQGELNQQVISGGSGTPVTAVPNPGFFFVQWSDGSQANPRTDSNVIADVNVTAQFAVNGNFVVTPVAGPGGSLSPNLAQVVAPGGVVQFTALPAPGFVIQSVSGCGGGLAGNVFTTAPVQANCQVQATFKSSNEIFELNYLAGPNGSIQGDADQLVPAGGDGEPVTAVADPGFFFVKWSDGLVQANRHDVNVSSDITVTAEFAENGTPVYMVTPSAGPGGTLSPNVPQLVVEAENALFTILPNPGFAIEQVTGCDGTLINNVYVTAPVFADCEVHATFVPSNEAFTLTYTAGPNGQVNGQGVVEVVVPAGGQGVEVEAQPAPGFFFVQWTDGSQQNPRLDTNVAADINVTAQFAADGTPVYQVVPLSGMGGALWPPIPQHIAEGNSAQFQVVPNPGFIIANIGGTCGGSLVGNIYTTDPVFADCTVEADFVASDEIFTLTYIAGPNGQVNGQAVIVQNVQAGGTAEPVQAQPAPGYMFVQWSDGWLENPRQDMNVVGDQEVTAQFVQDGVPLFTVTPIAGANGALSPPVPVQVEQGAVTQFTVLPDTGYGIESVGGTCGGNLAGNIFTTNPIITDCTVEATFFDDRIFYNGFGFGDEQQ